MRASPQFRKRSGDAVPGPVTERLYLGGEWVKPTGTGRIEVENPATEQIVASVPESTPADVDRAVVAARAAWPHWAALDWAKRATHLAALHEGLLARRDEMAATITAEMAAPVRIAGPIQVGQPLTVLKSFVDLLTDPGGAGEP